MTTPIPGHGLDPEEEQLLQQTAEHWRQVWNETPVQVIARIEDAAKQLIAVTSALQVLYAAIFAFSSIRTQVTSVQWWLPGWLLLLLFCTPLVCWLVSLAYATRVFVPRIRPGVNFNELSVSAWQKVKDAYGEVAEEKLRSLHRSQRWLIGSFVLVLVAVVLFVLSPAPAVAPVPIIIVTPTPHVLGSPSP